MYVKIYFLKCLKFKACIIFYADDDIFKICLCRYCTKQSMAEIVRIEQEEREVLDIFDLPVPVAVSLVLGWIFLGAVLFSLWDGQWSYIEAFYFFFISLR